MKKTIDNWDLLNMLALVVYITAFTIICWLIGGH